MYPLAQFVWTNFFFSYWTNDVTNFTRIICPPTCHLRFSIVVQLMLKLEWKCSQSLTMNPTCDIETREIVKKDVYNCWKFLFIVHSHLISAKWLCHITVNTSCLCSRVIPRDEHSAPLRDITSLLLFINNDDDNTTIVHGASFRIDSALLCGLFNLQRHSSYRYIRWATRGDIRRILCTQINDTVSQQLTAIQSGWLW